MRKMPLFLTTLSLACLILIPFGSVAFAQEVVADNVSTCQSLSNNESAVTGVSQKTYTDTTTSTLGSDSATTQTDQTVDSTSKGNSTSTSKADTVDQTTVTSSAASSSQTQSTASSMVSSAASGAEIVTTQILEDNGVYAISSALDANKNLDVAGGSTADSTNVQLYSNNSTLAQFFRVSWLGSGWYSFINLKSGKYLDVAGAGTADSTNVQQYTGNGTDAQKWGLVALGNGFYGLVPRNAQNSRLDIAGASTEDCTNAQIYTSNGTAAQSFAFIKNDYLSTAYSAAQASGYVSLGGDDVCYSIVSGLDNSKYVDILGASQADGANVQLYSSNGTTAQKYQFNYLGNGLYTILALCSGRVLDVTGGSMAAGANVQQYSSNGTLAQIWYLIAAANGYYNIKNTKSGMLLEVAGSGVTDGTNIEQNTATNTENQLFLIKTVQLIADGTYTIQTSYIAPMVLDVAGASAVDGANVQIYRSNGTGAQHYTFVYDSNTDTYSIICAGTGLYLDVAGAGSTNGTNVWTYTANGTLAQKWYALCVNGYYEFKSACNGLFLDVAAASRLGGSNIQVYEGNGTAAQLFNLKGDDWTFFSGASSDGVSLIECGEQFQGWEYVWGGRSPSTGFDCAGLVEYCANAVYGLGIDTMYTNAQSLFYNYCYAISAAEATVGDVCFFLGTYGDDIDYISHVVLYCGNGVCYGAGDPISYMNMSSIQNIYGQVATVIYARFYGR